MPDNIISKELENETMLYDTGQDKIHVLNATARMIYDLHKDGKTTAEIEDEIRKHFQSEKTENFHEDVQKCIEDLKKSGLIE
ncbi:MAG: PqqD family protein [Desulfobacterales bacterium]|nr:PqqD family protein [Desulfobacterales bacterium]